MSGNGPGSVQQTLQTTPGVEYTVTFDFAGTPGWGPSDLLVEAAGESAEYSFNEANSLVAMGWRPETFTFTATGTSTTLKFTSLEGNSAGPALDNVRVSSSGDFTTDEDVAAVLTGLSVADEDASAGPVQLSLAVANGDLGLGGTTGLTLVDGDGTDGTLVVSGALSDINTALAAGLTYTPDADYNGADTLSVTIDDQGNGGGSALSANQAIGIHIDAVTDTHAISTVTSLVNGSFETPLAPAGWFSTYGPGPIPGANEWTVTGNSIDLVGTLWAASDGIQSVDMNGNDKGGLAQDVATIQDATYRVTFDLWSQGTLQVGVGTLDEGSWTFAFAESGMFTTVNGAPWTQHAFEFTADDASTTLAFVSDDPAGPGGAVLDNVEIVRVIEDFTLGEGGDVLDLSALLGSGPHDATAFSGGYLQFDTSSGADTDILFDADGGADEYVPVVTLVGTTMTESDTDHYVL